MAYRRGLERDKRRRGSGLKEVPILEGGHRGFIHLSIGLRNQGGLQL